MDYFTISDLQHYSGIKAHTIRIWEQRYSALKPGRSEGNTRYYNGKQLKRLLNIVSLIDSEYKVSELCRMTDSRLHDIIENQLKQKADNGISDEYFISQILSAAVEYDESKFDKFFSNSVLRLGLKGTYVNVIYPVLKRLGLMWAIDAIPPAQEHFITSLIRQKILTATDAIEDKKLSDEKWILFLPEGEFHETGLLLSNYLIRLSGRKVYYLGADVSFGILADASAKIRPTHFMCFFVRNNDSESCNKLLGLLAQKYPGQKKIISSDESRIKEFRHGKNFTFISSVEGLTNELENNV